MMLKVFSIKVELLDPSGGSDEFSEAQICEEGLMLEGTFFSSIGISWEDLARVVSNPFVQEKLAESQMLQGLPKED